MSTQNVSVIEAIEMVEVTPAQARAIRKLSLGSNKKSAQELANDLFAQVVRGRFKAVVEKAGDEAGAKYDMLLASGLLDAESKSKLPTRGEFISRSKIEFADILSEL